MTDSEILPHRSKKNTKKWCKGVKGREHVLERVIPENRVNWWGCGWTERWRGYWPNAEKHREWDCSHVDRCKNCGKVLEQSPWFDNVRAQKFCPDFTE